MNVDAPKTREVQHDLGKDQSVGNDNQYVWLPRDEIRPPGVIAQSLRLRDGNPTLLGGQLDWARRQLPTAAFGSVWLSQHAHDDVP
jgi:hypothetical protein